MNILLDAFYDLNFGDDIFIQTITDMFPKCKFYSFLEHYPLAVIEWAKKIKNLYLLPECDVFLQKNMFDAYICVGGDVFPNNGDYSKRKKYVASVKQTDGVVVFWGFSLFHNYNDQTEADIISLMKSADVIAPRDEASADYLRSILPEQEIHVVADLAFLSDWKKRDSVKVNNILGISVRRPNYATDQDMQQYTVKLQEVIDSYLRVHEERQVIIFSLSVGNTSDVSVTNEIISGVADKNRVNHIVYTGNISEIKEEMEKCDLMICTRLHAMISCIAMEIPFIPIIYEVKMEHILDDIDYQKKKIYFNNINNISIQMDDFKDVSSSSSWWDKQKEDKYIAKTIATKELLQKMIQSNNINGIISKKDSTGPECEEKERIVTIYEAALYQRATDVATLEAALNQRATDVTTLEAALNQCATDVATLEAALNQRATDVATLEAALNQRAEEVAALSSRLQAIESTWQYRMAVKLTKK